MDRLKLFVLGLAVCFGATAEVAGQSASMAEPGPKPAVVATISTNAMSLLPPLEKVAWLQKELEFLFADWEDSLDDAAAGLLHLLSAPIQILSEELKRIELLHQQELAELRLELESLKQAQGSTQTNLASAPGLPPRPTATNQVEVRVVPTPSATGGEGAK